MQPRFGSKSIMLARAPLQFPSKLRRKNRRVMELEEEIDHAQRVLQEKMDRLDALRTTMREYAVEDTFSSPSRSRSRSPKNDAGVGSHAAS